MYSFDICSIAWLIQRPHPRSIGLASTRTVDRKGILHCRQASRFVVAAAATHVVASNETRLDAVEERFEVQEAGSAETEALNDLGADGYRPRVESGINWVLDPVPQNELAYGSCNNSASRSEAESCLVQWSNSHYPHGKE